MNPINSITIVNNLHNYLSILNKVEVQEKEYYKKNDISFPAILCKSVSLEYNTITAKLDYKNIERTTYSNFCRVTYEIKNQNISFTELSCEYSERENSIQNYVQQYIPTMFPSPTYSNTLSNETEEYLTIADEIAKQAFHCTSGDDYYPGFFSKIIISDTEIILKQINHMNSRSLNHKTNYSLRNLEFHIPNKITESPISFMKEKIGRMAIHFSDRSSKNNKICGDKILETIKEQKGIFESKNQ